jgi:hypothetical protein
MSLEMVMDRGVDRSWDFTLTKDDVAVDLTGATIAFSCRTKAGFDTGAATLALTSPTAIVIDPDQVTNKGQLTLNIAAADTVDLDRNITLLCDFQVTDSGGDVRTWPEALYGESTLIRLRIKGDVTRP